MNLQPLRLPRKRRELENTWSAPCSLTEETSLRGGPSLEVRRPGFHSWVKASRSPIFGGLTLRAARSRAHPTCPGSHRGEIPRKPQVPGISRFDAVAKMKEYAS